MIICYHRSSSLGTLEFCEQKYFLQYNLSLKDRTNKKALMGTIVHKALQVLGDKIPSEKGRLVIFPSFAAHKVLQFTKADRHMLISFAQGNTFK